MTEYTKIVGVQMLKYVIFLRILVIFKLSCKLYRLDRSAPGAES